MDNEKVIKIPISYSQRKINEMGNGYVPCEVSERWLQFDNESISLRSGEFIGVNVMTLGSDEQAKKICSVILNIEDIKRALANVKPQK
ncbi:hypothetical protein [Clostridium botulinum]|uniref:hypothetical protein n=1 Tax=Clostridium botulinum TaxID=1491 RepID=UPI000A171ECE|nr:hypothetical protein [Clostridium botulinum]AUN11581.1 hypothetical protein RSJ6_14165 [Clostridium botulinum]OSA71598.1 hypothetical protein B2H87_05970 [Clostridium botulinum]